jgi:poly(3-hydroxybutyrate) depolymerase
VRPHHIALLLATLGCATASAQPRARRTDGPAVTVAPDTVAFAGSLPATPGRHSARLTVAGHARDVLVYVPRRHAPSPPLVLALHGTNTEPQDMLDEAGAFAEAEAQGFVIVAPRARNDRGHDWDHPDNEGLWWSTFPDVDPDRNEDLLLVRAALSAATRDLRTDPSRAYVVGHSNGAFFALLVASVLHDRVAAWVSSSGGLCACADRTRCMFQGRGATCAALAASAGWCRCAGPALAAPIPTTGRRPPALLTHGTGDEMVSAYYTCALAERLRAAGHSVRVDLRDGAPHVMPEDFMRYAWRFLATQRLR